LTRSLVSSFWSEPGGLVMNGVSEGIRNCRLGFDLYFALH
jgi:hypothetical protein